MASSVVLLSAGLDSTVNLRCALDSGRARLALTFDYGQRAARRESAAAARMCDRLGVRHKVLPLKWLGAISDSALVKKGRPLPRPRPGHLDDPVASARTARRVWVPNRNAVLLAVAAAYAEALDADEVVAGFNAEEAAAFPDNSAEFVNAFNRMLSHSTMRDVKVRTYTGRRAKPAIVTLGLRSNAPLDLVWCCYAGGRRLCGKCESCLRFLRAIRVAGAETWFRENHPWMPAFGRKKTR